ncbi:hypothetical protein [Blautia pseudococcoides]|uniref:hypothetical protein n=1 Tax=Blautia pseudococcoides TaxID=1796616 RepID=UPI000A54A33A|nr:hypothetical protein [Blautia pseudococcoides]MCR2022778.1 hypothetical protein [Blautia pseudococcoides]QQQ95386.1 hypothetical protein I5Q86_12105 [Blautia pseudococcoides]
MKINEDNFIEQLKFWNEKALEYVIDNYGSIVRSEVWMIVEIQWNLHFPGGVMEWEE